MLRFRPVKHDTVIHHMFLVLRFYATCTVRFIPIATESWLFGATEVAFAHFYARHLKLPGIVAEQRSTKANAFQQKAATGSQPEAILLTPESESYQFWQCIAQIFSTRLTPKMEPLENSCWVWTCLDVQASWYWLVSATGSFCNTGIPFMCQNCMNHLWYWKKGMYKSMFCSFFPENLLFSVVDLETCSFKSCVAFSGSNKCQVLLPERQVVWAWASWCFMIFRYHSDEIDASFTCVILVCFIPFHPLFDKDATICYRTRSCIHWYSDYVTTSILLPCLSLF